MENADLLKEYFLSHATCVNCSRKYNEYGTNPLESGHGLTNIAEHYCDQHHEFRNFFIEQHMIPIIMQQFLVDLGIKTAPKTVVKHSNDALEDHSIDIKEIEQFWNDFLTTIPSDLELIWDTIDSGLTRYLQVNVDISMF